MGKLTRELRNALVSGKITEEEFIEQSKGEKISDEDYLRLLKEGFDKKDGVAVEKVIFDYSPSGGFSNKFSEIFCKLLQENWHFQHENIASILQGLEDVSTVDCLFSAAQLRFDYLDYNDTYQFARKCIKALSAINKLKLLAESHVTEIQQYAIKELKYKGLSN